MPDLHTALEAAITSRLEVARAAQGIGEVAFFGWGTTAEEDVARRVAAHARIHVPDDAIRRYTADLSLLDRYRRLNDEDEGDLTRVEIAKRYAQLDLLHELILGLLDVYPEVPDVR